MTTQCDYAELRRTACRLAELGVLTARPFFGKVGSTRKADDTPVTEADHAAQAAILDALARLHPAHAVLTEEIVARPQQHAAAGAAEFCWVVDPIDGTRNFGRGVGLWSTSVAVLQDGRPVAGAVCDATNERTYSASVSEGAFVGTQQLRLRDRPIDGDTTIAISSLRRRAMPAAVRGWLDCYLYRNLGSLCLHLAWVAAGLFDAAYAWECKTWDVAAGSLLIEQAGGLVTDHAGNPIWPVDVAKYRGEDLPILAGPPAMHARLLQDLRS